MPELSNARSVDEVDRDRSAELAVLIERAAREPGLAELLDVYRQDWYRLGTSLAQATPMVIRTVQVSTDSTMSFLWDR